ncbi:hypothetical protein CYMTET_8367 [Cymbomonas tetramitiformis]|uniref:Transmembrane protein n=1 Tax=Cymbomonas tetramitiformis TaxID=36881 RepID=A0AAE0GTU7_9CHLO|nr:hypothetical protein CYMTET_8367 [Cymbomonas tetramitiformis]
MPYDGPPKTLFKWIWVLSDPQTQRFKGEWKVTICSNRRLPIMRLVTFVIGSYYALTYAAWLFQEICSDTVAFSFVGSLMTCFLYLAFALLPDIPQAFPPTYTFFLRTGAHPIMAMLYVLYHMCFFAIVVLIAIGYSFYYFEVETVQDWYADCIAPLFSKD